MGHSDEERSKRRRRDRKSSPESRAKRSREDKSDSADADGSSSSRPHTHTQAEPDPASLRPQTQENNGEIAMSVEETNRIRAMLGMKPLAAPAQSAPPKTAEQTAVEHAEWQRERDLEETKAVIAKMKHKRELNAVLPGESLAKTIESSSVADWVARSRKLEQEKLRAAAAARALDESEELRYTSADLVGLKVTHDAAELPEGHEVVLTLKDRPILDPDFEDELENVNLQDDERTRERLKAKKLSIKYNPYDTGEQFDENGLPIEKKLLTKYDHDDKKVKSGLVIGDAGFIEDPEVRRQAEIKQRLREATAGAVSLDYKLQLATDYYTPDDIAKLRKPGTKRRRRVTRPKSAFELDLAAENQTEGSAVVTAVSRDHASRSASTKLRREQEEKQAARARKQSAWNNAVQKAEDSTQAMLDLESGATAAANAAMEVDADLDEGEVLDTESSSNSKNTNTNTNNSTTGEARGAGAARESTDSSRGSMGPPAARAPAPAGGGGGEKTARAVQQPREVEVDVVDVVPMLPSPDVLQRERLQRMKMLSERKAVVVAAAIAQQRAADEQKSKPKATAPGNDLVLNEISEFCRNIGNSALEHENEKASGGAGGSGSSRTGGGTVSVSRGAGGLSTPRSRSGTSSVSGGGREGRAGWKTLTVDEAAAMDVDKTEDDDDDDEETGLFGREQTVAVGVAAALNAFRARGLLEETLSGRSSEQRQFKRDREIERGKEKDSASAVGTDGASVRSDAPPAKQVRIEYLDELGRPMTAKEAYRHQCHKFHGKKPGKASLEKRLRRIEEEKKRSQAFLENPISMHMLTQAQANTHLPYLEFGGNMQQIMAAPLAKKKKKG